MVPVVQWQNASLWRWSRGFDSHQAPQLERKSFTKIDDRK